MSQLLMWERPARKDPPDVHHRRHSADNAPPGAYVPNMSEADRLKWRARRVRGNDPRVEIRKGTENGSSLLMVVRADSTTISMSNKLVFDEDTWQEFCRARDEAATILQTP